MQLRGTPLHIVSVVSALAAAPAAAQDGGVPPGECGAGGGWATYVDGSDVPANIPSFRVDIFAPLSETGVVTLARRTAAGDVPIEADVTTVAGPDGPAGVFHTYVIAPRAPLTVGQSHVFSFSGTCIGTMERVFGALPAVPLPAPPATVTATLIQTVRDGRRDDTFVRVDLELAADVTPWADSLSFDVVVDDAARHELHLPFESTTLLRRDLRVYCTPGDVRVSEIAEGEHDFRAEVGGFGVLAPALEVSTTATVDCDERLYIHALTGVPLTPAEIEALGPEPLPCETACDAAILPIDGGVGADASAASLDADVEAPAPSGGCSAAPARASTGAFAAMLVALGALARSRRR